MERERERVGVRVTMDGNRTGADLDSSMASMEKGAVGDKNQVPEAATGIAMSKITKKWKKEHKTRWY
jgi:hypothetical protein